MQLVITVGDPTDPAESTDVVLDVQADTPVTAVAGAATDRFLPPEAPLYLLDEALPPDITVRDAGLVSGDHLGLGTPLAGPDAGIRPGWTGRHWLEIHGVSGADAGRVWPIEFGSLSIGFDHGHAIRLTGPPTTAPGPVLTVDRFGRAWLTGLAPTEMTAAGVSRPTTHATDPGARLAHPIPPPEAAGDDREKPDRRVEQDAAEHLAQLTARAAGAQPWPVGLDLVVGTSLLRLVERFDPDAAVAPSEDVIGRDFNRPPRIVPPLLYAPIRLPRPPSRPNRRPIPLLMMLAPMILGLAFVVLFHSYFFLLISLLSPVMAISNWVQDRRSGRKQYRKDSARYRERRADTEQQILRTVTEERAARCEAAPDPGLLGLTATGPGRRLWERRRSDLDYLVLRVGTADQPSLLELEDPAREEGRQKYRWTIPDVPVGVDLADRGVVGVAGDAAGTAAVARWMVAQAAVLHSPRDLRIHILGGLSQAQVQERWEWARWLPHCRPSGPGDGPFVTIGNDPETVVHRVQELLNLIRARTQARASRMGNVLFAEPDVLIVMDGARQLRDVPGVVQLLTDGPAVRVFSLCLDALERLLPEECTSVVRCDPDGLVVRQTNSVDVEQIRPDTVNPAWCDTVARALSSLRDVTPDESGGLPDRVRLLDLLDADPPDAERIAQSWLRRPASTAFPIGKGFEGAVTFDLVRDGPHGLIAGTTGSGKSELLQTMVASLAAVNRPDELVFVLVDYKGGSAFHSCVDLPHTLGMVTDLDEALSMRALESLSAELRRREHILAEVGAKDLPEYRALRGRDPDLAPLPRLLLVIDEFATMARETPAFVPGLVSIAQRGRSLGVHLILATQRPAGVVTADIKANTNLRIALRVTDPGESNDVIDTNDATHFSTANPGRALARLAHRSTLPFQTAYVGGPIADPEDSERTNDEPAAPVKPPRAEPLPWSRVSRPLPAELLSVQAELPSTEAERTDLDALVEAIQEAAIRVDSRPQPSPWLPALPPVVLLADLERTLPRELGDRAALSGGLPRIPFALVDLPSRQSQRTHSLDLDTLSHLFVIGSPRAGRSQTLRTLAGSVARACSSADVHLYGIDAGGGSLSVLSELPHCGAVVPRSDLERLSRLIGRLTAELAARQELLSERSAADLAELRALLPVADRPAHLLVFVDGWDALAALLIDHDGGHLHAGLMDLLREGAGVGIHLIMTSERTLALGRVSTMSEHKIMLRMTDRTDYALIGVPPIRVPSTVPAGRAWQAADHAELQIALLDRDPSGAAQGEALRTIARESRARDRAVPAARRPFPIAVLPSAVTFTDAFDKVTGARRKPMHGLIGLGGSDLDPILIDFTGRAQTFLIAGPSGSGRSNALAALGVSLLAAKTSQLVVITPRESPLRRLASHAAVHLVTGQKPDPAPLAERLSGAGPTVILIDDVDLLGLGNPLEPLLREVVGIGRDRQIGLAFAGSPETLGQALGGWLGEARRSKQGILLAPQSSMEGELIGARLPPSLLLTEVRPGRGYMVGASRSGRLGTVVIPQTELR
jgi:S-DNA-T family DNA segregation ATPase FtsK/SpoIIIE